MCSSAPRSPTGARRSTRSCTRRPPPVCRWCRATCSWTSSSQAFRCGSDSRGGIPTISRGSCSRVAAAGPEVRAAVGGELRRRVEAGHSVESWADAVIRELAGGLAAEVESARDPQRRSAGQTAGDAPGAAPGRAERHPIVAAGSLSQHGRRRQRAGPSASLALVALDIVGLALGLMAALVIRTILYGDTVYWSLLWRTGTAEWLPFLAPGDRARVLPGGPLLRARAARRLGPGRLVARPRRADRPRVRPRHRATNSARPA